MRRPPLAAVLTAVVLSACDATPATIMTQTPKSHRPAAVRLTPEVRSRLQPNFDVDALEELLGTLTLPEREELLSVLGAPGTRQPVETTEVRIPMRSTDPARQELLDRIWAPFWSHLPPQALDREDLPYPGRELARARRAGRSRPADTGRQE